MTQQEQEAIEAYAKEIMKSGCVSNERDFVDGMLKGAKFALSELRKPSEENRARIQELLWAFSCDASANPKEITEEIIRAAQMCEPEPSNICPECGYPRTTQGNGIVERICTCGEPSEPIGRTDEELVKKIELCMEYESVSLKNYDNYPYLCGMSFRKVATEIAKLLPSIPTYYPYDSKMFQELFNYMSENYHVSLLESEMDEIMRICLKVVGGKVAPENQKNDVNVELLEALKDMLIGLTDIDYPDDCDDYTIFNTGYTKEMIENAKLAISNYEKQINNGKK